MYWGGVFGAGVLAMSTLLESMVPGTVAPVLQHALDIPIDKAYGFVRSCMSLYSMRMLEEGCGCIALPIRWMPEKSLFSAVKFDQVLPDGGPSQSVPLTQRT